MYLQWNPIRQWPKKKNNQKKPTKKNSKKKEKKKQEKVAKTNNYNRNSNNNKIPTMKTNRVESFRYIEVKQMKDILNSQFYLMGKNAEI